MRDKILKSVCNSPHREISSDLVFFNSLGCLKVKNIGTLAKGLCECVGPLFSLALPVPGPGRKPGFGLRFGELQNFRKVFLGLSSLLAF